MPMVRRRRRSKRNSTARPSSSAWRIGAASAGGGSSNSASCPGSSCCVSIHSSAIALIVSGSRPALSIGGPIRTVTSPGYLRKELRGQNRPALCATGTTSAPACAASQAPPRLVLARLARARRACLRETPPPRSPARRRSLPRRAICRSAAMPRPRLIAIGLISARPQPKNGIQSSSRLSTCTCGGKICWKASVSQADWCLDRITAGCAGRCSRPSTRPADAAQDPQAPEHQPRPAGDDAVAQPCAAAARWRARGARRAG